MKIQCDACESAAAAVVCCADEAALCAACDVEVHAANKLAGKHQRLPLEALSARLPRCDVCQEKAAFIFCVEDRALFCRDCDEPIHVPGTLSGNHQRYLATGIRVGFASASPCDGGGGDAHDTDHHAPPMGSSEHHHHHHHHHHHQQQQQQQPAQTAAVDTQQAPSPQFLPQGWAVDELLQFSDYESGDKASTYTSAAAEGVAAARVQGAGVARRHRPVPQPGAQGRRRRRPDDGGGPRALRLAGGQRRGVLQATEQDRRRRLRRSHRRPPEQEGPCRAPRRRGGLPHRP